MPARSALPITVLLLLALAGCGRGDGEPADTATGDYVARVQALNEKERDVVLFRALHDAGRDCQGVERSTETDPVNGKPSWIATCDNGTDWLVTIGDDGVATVTDARALARRVR